MSPKADLKAKNKRLLLSKHLSFKDTCKFYVAQWLVALGKLTHDDFTKSELHVFLKDSFPYDCKFNIPIGEGSLSILEGNITLDNENNRIGLQCLAAIKIEAAATTLYRAHLIFTVSAVPHYEKITNTLSLKDISTDSVTLVNDDYAFIKDTQFIINRFFPKTVNSLINSTLKSALSVLSAGTADIAADYLKLYLTGSKQAILDYHIPQIDSAIKKQLAQQDLSHTMRENHWREALFAKLGKSVRVEDDVLRFYLR